MNKKYLILLTLLLLPVLALAQGGGGSPTLGSMAAAIAHTVVEVGQWIVVIMWVVTGVLFLAAQGDPGKLGTAKMALFTSIGGTIIILIANGAVGFVSRSFGL